MPLVGACRVCRRGLVSLRTKITASPASPFYSASSAVKTIVPVAAPGEAGRSFASISSSTSGWLSPPLSRAGIVGIGLLSVEVDGVRLQRPPGSGCPCRRACGRY